MAYDEMMVRFEGRGKHTYRMPNKPITEGYKIFALCDYGYTWNWLLTSRICGIAELNSYNGLTSTASGVYQLSVSLPYQHRQYNIYMDNLFSSIPLFSMLRDIGISACSTTRTGEKKFPKTLLEAVHANKVHWNDLRPEVTGEGRVLTIRWEDNNTVKMLTIHRIEEAVLSNRRRPRNTSTRGPEIWSGKPKNLWNSRNSF